MYDPESWEQVQQRRNDALAREKLMQVATLMGEIYALTPCFDDEGPEIFMWEGANWLIGWCGYPPSVDTLLPDLAYAINRGFASIAR